MSGTDFEGTADSEGRPVVAVRRSVVRTLVVAALVAVSALVISVGTAFAGTGYPLSVQAAYDPATSTLTVSGSYYCNDRDNQGGAVFQAPNTPTGAIDSMQRAAYGHAENQYDILDNCTSTGSKPFSLSYSNVPDASGQQFCLVVYHRKSVNNAPGVKGNNLNADGQYANTDNSWLEERHSSYAAGDCATVPARITQALRLRNTVTNSYGGTAVATAWTLSGTGPTSISGTTPVNSGPSFAAGTYTLAQTGGPTGYTAGAWSCVLTGSATPVAVVSGAVTVGAGKDVTCTINNVDSPKGTPPPSTPKPPSTPPTSTPPTSTPPSIGDVSIQKTATPRVTLGSNGVATIVYGFKVQNNGPIAAAAVTVADAAPRGVTFGSVSSQPGQGSCSVVEKGAMVSCSIGTLATGASVSFTVKATVRVTGTVINTAFVTTTTTESNGDNNRSSAQTVSVGTFRPATVASKPVAQICQMVSVAPKMLKANGKLQTLRLVVTKAGKGVAGTRISIRGAGISTTVKSGKKGIVVAKVRTTKPGILRVTIEGSKSCGSQRLGVVGSYEPPVTG